MCWSFPVTETEEASGVGPAVTLMMNPDIFVYHFKEILQLAKDSLIKTLNKEVM